MEKNTFSLQTLLLSYQWVCNAVTAYHSLPVTLSLGCMTSNKGSITIILAVGARDDRTRILAVGTRDNKAQDLGIFEPEKATSYDLNSKPKQTPSIC